MKILFVWPNKGDWGFHPIGLSILMAIVKDKHEIDLFDATYINTGGCSNNKAMEKAGVFKPVDDSEYCLVKMDLDIQRVFWDKLNTFNPDIVAFSVLTDEVELATKMTNLANVYGAITVWGNKAATITPELAHRNGARVCFLGESFQTFPKFVDECDRIVPNIKGIPVEDIGKLPYYDWTLFDRRHFIKKFDGKIYRGGDYMIGYGCVNACTYCTNSVYKDHNKLRILSVNRAVNELNYLCGVWDLNFMKYHDENFLLKSQKWLVEFASAYADVKLPFTCMAYSKSVTPSKAEILAKIGCKSVSLGFESGSPRMRKLLGRRDSIVDVKKAVFLLKANGIRTVGFNMIGLPTETEKDIEMTIEANVDIGFDVSNVTFFIPLPMVPLSEGVRHILPYRMDKPNIASPVSTDILQHYYDNFNKLIKNY